MDFNQLFPDVRETGNTRLQQCQFVLLRMLRIVDYLCSKHQVPYFLTAGTLLGAIRHQGFIPWDDDLDIGMTRDGYERFKKLVVPELPQDIFFQTPETDLYPSCHGAEAKLRDRYSSYATHGSKPWHRGLMLDIMVYDRAFLPHNIFIYALNRAMVAAFWGIKPYNTGNEKRGRVLTAIARWCPLPLVYSNMYIRKRPMVRKYGANFFTRKELQAIEHVSFEGFMMPVPKGWHSYLKRKYGAYRQLPPAHKQVTHGKADACTPCNHPLALPWHQRRPAVRA